MASLGEDDSGQVIILLSLIMVFILSSVSVLHAQNILAGMESSRTLMVFPKNDIRNLQEIVEDDIRGEFGRNKQDFNQLSEDIRNQVNTLYAHRGVYADVIVFGANPDDGVNNCNVRIIYLSGELEFKETMLCREEGCI
ncbi:MAG: hypothetical protein ACLFVI_04060 [Archaeoglobaceae archaeon]